MKVEDYLALRVGVVRAGFRGEIVWSESIQPPLDAEAFASEAIYVICNSGMKQQIARRIFDRVMEAIQDGLPSRKVFGHTAKAAAIDHIWVGREILFQAYVAAEDKVEFCGALPWIGGITKWHLAKNFGADVVKPDRHLVRIADHYGVTPTELCTRLADATGDRVATVDLVLWRASNLGLIDTSGLKKDRPHG